MVWSRSDEMMPVIEMKSDKRKVMMWDGISRKGQTPLFFWKIRGDFSVDAYEYTEYLEQCLFEEMDDLYGEGRWRLLQDNARPHTSYHSEFSSR